MTSCEALIVESAAVDGEPSLSSRIGNISSQDNESIDNFVKFGIEVMQFHIVCLSVLTCAQPSEILTCFGCKIIEQLEYNSARSSCTNLNVDINLVVRLRTHFIIDNPIISNIND